ncbi:response regulator [Polaribacter litorisediminis]|uniref:response regulator n=1 Tax=Polaribacter litorisediminis TaxID=1908341 RepID=UPI001CBF0841|nr:response regulator [Polaribacter litorisediminis]UAM98409.1 response regulator [Polaribacter litorisediminis]
MFEKVLVVEDFDLMNSGIEAALYELSIRVVDSIAYCDEAFLKIKEASLKGEPYHLIISDLSFQNGGPPQKLKCGEDFIKKIRYDFPDLKIIIFSIEDALHRIQYLYNNLKIQGYVWKNRNGLQELKKAVHSIFTSDEFYVSPDLNMTIHPRKALEITDFDVFLILNLSKGFPQEEISKKLKQNGIKPSSISVVEKRLKFLKGHFNAKNPTHLVSIAKDLGVI